MRFASYRKLRHSRLAPRTLHSHLSVDGMRAHLASFAHHRTRTPLRLSNRLLQRRYKRILRGLISFDNLPAIANRRAASGQGRGITGISAIAASGDKAVDVYRIEQAYRAVVAVRCPPARALAAPAYACASPANMVCASKSFINGGAPRGTGRRMAAYIWRARLLARTR